MPPIQCPAAFIQVSEPGVKHPDLTASCLSDVDSMYSDNALGYFEVGGALVGQFNIVGCNATKSDQPSIRIIAMDIDSDAPSVSNGSIYYIDADGHMWTGTTNAAITITTPPTKVGVPVEGTYKGDVTYNGQTKSLSGSFLVCRSYDINFV
jgi:hypothetical protein